MATAVLEQVVLGANEVDRGKKHSPSAKNYGAGEFADLIKDKPKLVCSAAMKGDHANKSSKNLKDKQEVSEDQELKIVKSKGEVEENDVAPESMMLAAMLNQPNQIVAVPFGGEGEFAQLAEGDENILGQEFVVPVINVVTKVEGDLPTVSIQPELVSSGSTDSSSEGDNEIRGNLVATENAQDDATFVVQQGGIVVSDLSDQEQSLIQSMKSFRLPDGFSNDFGLNKNLNKSQEITQNQFVSNEKPVAQNVGVSLKSVGNENAEQAMVSTVIVNEDVSSRITISLNLLLADETRQGQLVLAKMNSSLWSETKNSSMIQGESKLNLENQDNFSGLEQDADEFGSKKHSLLDSFGGALGVNSEDLFQVSFRENALNLGAKNSPPKPDMQISLAVKEVLNVSGNEGKKEVIINLFPEALGPIKVEILSVLGENGARKIESIKVIAEKRETLEILEKSRMELEKNLKEVTNTKEEASLQFEMNHQGKGSSGAYFSSSEERDNWMNNFVTEEDSVNGIVEYESQNPGYITEDSINIKV